MLLPSVPEIDASAGKLNLRMTEGDPIAFSFIVEGAASWAGSTFTAEVRDALGNILTFTVTCSVSNTTDCLIVISHASAPTLTPTRSGYGWAMLESDGPTKFSGLLFVEELL